MTDWTRDDQAQEISCELFGYRVTRNKDGQTITAIGPLKESRVRDIRDALDQDVFSDDWAFMERETK